MSKNDNTFLNAWAFRAAKVLGEIILWCLYAFLRTTEIFLQHFNAWFKGYINSK